MTDAIICELPKSTGKVVRAKITSYKGSEPYLDIREWYLDVAGDYQAGRGITIPLERVPQLATALWHHLENAAPARLKIA